MASPASGANATMAGLDRPRLQKQLSEFLHSPQATDVVRHPIDALRALSELVESAPRLG